MSVSDLSCGVCGLSGGGPSEELTCDCSRGACVALISVNPGDPHQNRSVSSVCGGPAGVKARHSPGHSAAEPGREERHHVSSISENKA